MISAVKQRKKEKFFAFDKHDSLGDEYRVSLVKLIDEKVLTKIKDSISEKLIRRNDFDNIDEV